MSMCDRLPLFYQMDINKWCKEGGKWKIKVDRSIIELPEYNEDRTIEDLGMELVRSLMDIKSLDDLMNQLREQVNDSDMIFPVTPSRNPEEVDIFEEIFQKFILYKESNF